MRTHTCGELRLSDVDTKVTLAGWTHVRRDHGGVIFVDLRDRYGKTQIVFNPEIKDFKIAEKLRREDVILLTGKVRARGKELINPKLETGEIEVVAETITLVGPAETPLLEIEDAKQANDDVRLQYRYLDLRRPIMQRNLLFRHKVIAAARQHFYKNNFLEIETPLLVKSTPEGARDYVVPSRVHKGHFYALPQSPQLYKQILMVAGVDKYFQVARCLRDEDLRADRQPEHTQLDFEMSFVTQKDIQVYVEDLMKHIFKETMNVDIVTPFKVMSYSHAMNTYGTDKPDLRYDLHLTDVTDIAVKTEFAVFANVAKNGGLVKVINPEKAFGRADLDAYVSFCITQGAKGMAWMKVNENLELEGSIIKYFSPELQKALVERIQPKPNSVLMFIADKKDMCNFVLDKLRRKLADDLQLYDPKEFNFCWINDFRMFAWNAEENRWEPEHHMFSMVKPEFIDTFEKEPERVLGDLWDLTLNGVEMASGSIRVSNPELQKRIMNFIGIDAQAAEQKFGFLLDAYKYGGPIHGGMGIGADRLIAMMLGYSDIREVIAFPKNKSAQCPMDSCPNSIDEKQWKELGLTIEKRK